MCFLRQGSGISGSECRLAQRSGFAGFRVSNSRCRGGVLWGRDLGFGVRLVCGSRFRAGQRGLWQEGFRMVCGSGFEI